MVILGGGYAGVAVARALAGRVDLTLVEPGDRFFHHIGAPRALVDDGFADTLFIPYDRVLAAGRRAGAAPARHVRGAVVSVDAEAKTVTVALALAAAAPGGGAPPPEPAVLPYDILVVALGSKLGAPAKPVAAASALALADLARVRAAVAAAGEVVIIGGGPTGVDMAGEIATAFPRKVVHLVHRQATLLAAGLLPALTSAAAAALAKLGVRVHLNSAGTVPATLPEGVAALAGGGVLVGKLPVSLSDGTTLHSDVLIYATGGAPNAGPLRASSPALAGALDAAGRLRVEPTLLVSGCTHVFAAGDICATQETKLAYAANLHAAVVAKNVAELATAMAAGRAEAPAYRATYKATPKPSLLLTIGPTVGLGQMNGGMLPGWIVRMVKAGDLLTARQNGELGWKKAGVYEGAAAPATA